MNLQTFFRTALDGGEWSSPRSGRFNAEEALRRKCWNVREGCMPPSCSRITVSCPGEVL